MNLCAKCGLPLRADESLLCFECDPSILEGCIVQDEFGKFQGKAFIRNSKAQWLVVWDDGSLDVVHQNHLKRVIF